MIFLPEKWRISLFCFTIDEETFVVLNLSEKHTEKQWFLVLCSFIHNLTEKLIFFSKKSKQGIKFDLLLIPRNVVFDALNYAFDALLHSQSIQSVEIEKYKTKVFTNSFNFQQFSL